MLNQVILVGRLTRDVKLNKTENGKKIATLPLAIPRSFKNMDGIYDTDFVDCIIWDVVATNTAEYCHKGDVVAIKGRIQSRTVEEKEIKKNILEVVAEKVTFLTGKPKELEEKEEQEIEAEE